jgi:spermidine/putrescine transport system permease protein
MTAMLNTSGIINSLLLGLGLIDAPLAMMYTPGAVILGLVYMLLPFMILPLYAALERLDRRYIEAARDLGASPCKTFWRVIVPLTSPASCPGACWFSCPASAVMSRCVGRGQGHASGNFIRDSS